MTYLLDVNACLALATHAAHPKAFAWAQGKSLAVCPLTELGFLHVSSQPRGLNVTMSQAEQLLQSFHRNKKPAFVPDDQVKGWRALQPETYNVLADSRLWNPQQSFAFSRESG